MESSRGARVHDGVNPDDYSDDLYAHIVQFFPMKIKFRCVQECDPKIVRCLFLGARASNAISASLNMAFCHCALKRIHKHSFSRKLKIGLPCYRILHSGRMNRNLSPPIRFSITCRRFSGDFVWRCLKEIDCGMDTSPCRSVPLNLLASKKEKLLSVESVIMCIMDPADGQAAFDTLCQVAPQLRFLLLDGDYYSDEQLSYLVSLLTPSRLERLDISHPTQRFLNLFFRRDWPILRYIGYNSPIVSRDLVERLAARTGALTAISLWTSECRRSEARVCLDDVNIIAAKNPLLRVVYLESALFEEVDDMAPSGNSAVTDSEDLFVPLKSKGTFAYDSSTYISEWLDLLLPGFRRQLQLLPEAWEKTIGFPLEWLRFNDLTNAWASLLHREAVYFDSMRVQRLYDACFGRLDELESVKMLFFGTSSFCRQTHEPTVQWAGVVEFCMVKLDPLFDRYLDWMLLQRFGVDYTCFLLVKFLYVLLKFKNSSISVQRWFHRLLAVLPCCASPITTLENSLKKCPMRERHMSSCMSCQRKCRTQYYPKTTCKS
jgi:hypothetical protein